MGWLTTNTAFNDGWQCWCGAVPWQCSIETCISSISGSTKQLPSTQGGSFLGREETKSRSIWSVSRALTNMFLPFAWEDTPESQSMQRSTLSSVATRHASWLMGRGRERGESWKNCLLWTLLLSLVVEWNIFFVMHQMGRFCITQLDEKCRWSVGSFVPFGWRERTTGVEIM